MNVIRRSGGRRSFGTGAVATVLLLAATGSASAGWIAGVSAFDPVGRPAMKVDAERDMRRDGLLECCWRSLRGQSLIGTYCGRSLLERALAEKRVKIIESGGRKVCTYGDRAF
jgi:hypothetical protein